MRCASVRCISGSGKVREADLTPCYAHVIKHVIFANWNMNM